MSYKSRRTSENLCEVGVQAFGKPLPFVVHAISAVTVDRTEIVSATVQDMKGTQFRLDVANSFPGLSAGVEVGNTYVVFGAVKQSAGFVKAKYTSTLLALTIVPKPS